MDPADQFSEARPTWRPLERTLLAAFVGAVVAMTLMVDPWGIKQAIVDFIRRIQAGF